MTHIYNLYGLYELCEHVSSNFLDQKMIYHRITFVIFMAFINCIDVFLQIPCNRRWFSTEFTFEIFVAVVSCVVVSLCVFKALTLENDLPQDSHLKYFWTLAWMFFFIVSAWEIQDNWTNQKFQSSWNVFFSECCC